ncbi:MAG: sulfatase-like hydrolase/transferase [Polyangiales bacterium]
MNALLRVLAMASFGLFVACGDDDAASDAGELLVDVAVQDPDAGPPQDASARDARTGSDAGGSARPNILLVIADDMGIDSSAQYDVSEDVPNTPTLDGLAATGIVFDDAWATPACTTTRGTLISGLHGVHSGVDFVPAVLAPDTRTLHAHLAEHSPEYATAIVGKWHLGGRTPDLNAPLAAGVGYYAGTIAGVIDDYFDWDLTTGGELVPQSTYHTTAMTDLAIEWIENQEGPWFMWLAYVAPHIPFHAPPESLHERSLLGTPADIRNNRREYYLAAIEAMDHELGRLLATLSDEERDNTLIVFLGDNGTPSQAVDVDVFAPTQAKNTLYEGGVRIPLIVSGAGVREGVRDPALVHTVDLFPTLLQVLGLPSDASLDGESFADVLVREDAGTREFNYTEFVSDAVTGWAVRDERYKLIHFEDGTEELYDLSLDLAETNNLVGDAALQDRAAALAAYGVSLRQ